MSVHLSKHFFLRLFMLFACILFITTAFPQKTHAIDSDLDVGSTAWQTQNRINSSDAFFQAEWDNNVRAIERARLESDLDIAADKRDYAEFLNGSAPEDTTPININNYVPPSATESFIYNTTVSIGGWFVSWGGSLFDLAVTKVVLEMGCWFVADGGAGCEGVAAKGAIGGVVNELWVVIRDLFNIAFIFSLVYIGLRTILNSEDSGTQKALGMLIAAALLINFSLYITKVIVDISNYTAVSIHSVSTQGISNIYSLKVSRVGDDGGSETIVDNVTGKDSLSGAFMETLRISSFFEDQIGLGQVVLFSVIALFFLVILGIVFVYGAFMLVMRFIALIIFMIFSPVMFLGWILPHFKTYSTQWWSKFISYAFFAPAYIFMLYLALYTLTQLKDSFKGNYSSAVTNGGSVESFSVFLFYAIGIGFLVAAVKVADLMGIHGSQAAMAAVKGVKNKSLGATKWAGGYGANHLGGIGGRKLQEWSEAREARTGKSGVRSRILRATGENLQNRKIGGAPSYKDTRDAVKTSNTRAARAGAVRNFSETLATTDIAAKQKAFADMTDAQLIDIAKTNEGRTRIKDNAHMLSSSQMQAIAKSEDINDTDTSAIAGAHQTETKAHVQKSTVAGGVGGIHKASTDQLNAIGFDNLNTEDNAINLTNEKIDKMKIVDEHKRQLKDTRKEALKKVVHTNTPIGVVTIDSLAKLSPSKIAELPDDIFYSATPAAAPHVKSFVSKLSFNTLEELGRKKDSAVTQQMRSILSSVASSTAAPGTHELELHNWLTTDRIGVKFGK